MKNRQGAKKLYKAHKTWIAAGLAAATLFSVQALGTQTVAADTPANTSEPATTDAKTALLNILANNKDRFTDAGIGNVTDVVTNRSFYGDIDYLKSQVESGAITNKTELYSAMKSMTQGYAPVAKQQLLAHFASVVNQFYGNGRSIGEEISYLFDNAKAVSDDQSAHLDMDNDAFQAVLSVAEKAAQEAATKKTIKIDLIDEETNVVLKQLSYTVDQDDAVSMDQVTKELPAGYTIDEANSKHEGNKYYVAVKASSKTIKVDYIDTTTLQVLKQTSYTVASNGGVSRDQIESDVPAGYAIDETQIGWDQANNKYYVGVYKKAEVTPTAPKTPATPTKTATSKATTPTKTVPAAKKATKTLPKTGDTTNTVASSIGVVAVIGALFGLAGTTKKRA